MKDSFEYFLFNKLGIRKTDSFVLAVSGGMDSMCMWDLFRKSGLRYIVAHCNFKLRGEASDLDEKFVSEFALVEEKVFTKSFETAEYAKKHSLSIQMAARNLRYGWFAELKDSTGMNYIATAHHIDDQVETFFVQLLRRSGLHALSGMPVKTGSIVRPLMFAGRESIETHIANHEIPYREDESNSSDAYMRNRIRKNLIPALKKVLPDFKVSVLELMGNMKEVSLSVENYCEKKKKELYREGEDESRISIEAIRQLEFPQIFLEHFTRSMGFSTSAAGSLFRCLDGGTGKVFYSGDFRIIRDREDLIITRISGGGREEFSLNKSELSSIHHLFFRAELLENEGSILSRNMPASALLDYARLGNRITFRKWRKGDYFYPLGLGGRKKLSDYFIDRKFSIADKERQWIMCSGEDICWIIGHSIDDRFKISDETKQVLYLEQH